MKKLMLIATIALAGCVQIDSYQDAVQTPAPASLQGYWQTTGPQSELRSEQAMGSLIINADGSTLDCRQWMRVIAKPGKLTRLSDNYVNVNRQSRVMPLTLDEGTLHYDGLTLRRVDRPTVECQKALDTLKQQPGAQIIQKIEPERLKSAITRASEEK